MFTEPKHFSRWLAPTGFEMNFLRPEIKTGGTSFYSMSGGGTKMYGKANYLEIIKPRHIVYTQYFCDENEKISTHPHIPGWPEAMLTTITLDEEGPDKTRVTIKWEVSGKATLAERETFNKSKSNMNQGWDGSLHKLEDYLKSI